MLFVYPLEITNFYFVRDCQLEITLGLGMGFVSVFSLNTGTPSDLDLCRPVHTAMVLILLYLGGLVSLVSFILTGSFIFLPPLLQSPES